MNKHLLLIILTYALTPVLLHAADDEPGFVSIFNDSDLSGWDGKPGAWEVRDGEIWCTGASKEKNWLIWRGGEPADFILRLEFRWDKGNSGVQVRSDELGKWQVFGYQVEIATADVISNENSYGASVFPLLSRSMSVFVRLVGWSNRSQLDPDPPIFLT